MPNHQVNMPSKIVRVDWIKDQLFLLRDRSDFPIFMAQPSGVSGADLLPLSLIGCAAWEIMSILHKQRQVVTGFDANAESERDESPPWRFRKIRIKYHFSGHNLNRAFIQRAIDLTEQKYCSIFATLREAVEITSEFTITDQPG